MIEKPDWLKETREIKSPGLKAVTDEMIDAINELTERVEALEDIRDGEATLRRVCPDPGPMSASTKYVDYRNKRAAEPKAETIEDELRAEIAKLHKQYQGSIAYVQNEYDELKAENERLKRHDALREESYQALCKRLDETERNELLDKLGRARAEIVRLRGFIPAKLLAEIDSEVKK